MRETYKKYTFKKFLSLDPVLMQEYESTGLLLKPDSWGINDFMTWPYITVKEIQLTLSQDYDYEQVINIIKELTGMSVKKILGKSWIDIFKFIKFVFKSIERINELEKKLIYEPDADEQNAGIEMYNEFGVFATIDRLAGGDPLKYDEIGKTEFSVIFVKLRLNQVDVQFAKNYQKVMMNKK